MQVSVRTLLAGVVGLTGLLGTVLVGAGTYREIAEELKAAATQDLEELGKFMAARLERGVFLRWREVQAVAALPVIRGAGFSEAEQRLLLDRLASAYGDYAWIGIAAADGRVTAASGGMFVGEDVTDRPWFVGGRRGPFIGYTEEAFSGADGQEALRGTGIGPVVTLAAPVRDTDGELVAVLGALLDERWAYHVDSRLVAEAGQRQQLQILVVGRDGRVLFGPRELERRPLAPVDGDQVLEGRVPALGEPNYSELGWSIVVRQAAEHALAPVYEVRWHIFLWSVAVALLLAGLGCLLAARIARPLRVLTKAAQRLRQGDGANLPGAGGYREVTALSQALSELVDDLRRSERGLELERSFLETLLRQAPVGISIAEAPSGRAVVLNDVAMRMMGLTAASSSAVDRYDGYGGRHVDGRPYRIEDYPTIRAMRSGRAIEREAMIYHRPDGSTALFEVSSAPVPDAEGAVVAVVTAMVDVTASRETEAALRESEARFRNMADNAPVMIWVTDPSGRCTYLSRSWYAFTGQGELAGLGVGWLEAIHPDDRAAAAAAFEAATRTKSEYRIEYRLQHADGVYRYALSAATPRHDAAGTFLGYVGSVIDITDRHQAEQRLRDLAMRDPLTGLANRAAFRERLTEVIARMGAAPESDFCTGPAKPGVAVLLLDIDNFKDVNDTLGHPAGDLLIAQVAARLREEARVPPSVARLGGDEFVIILEAAAGREEVAAVAAAALATLATAFAVDGHELTVSASIGIALGPEDGADPDRLLRNADLALYQAKSEGRGMFRFYAPEMSARVERRKRLERELGRALEQNQFELHHQPQFLLEGESLIGVEALVRWRHPERGLVMPGAFLSEIETAGLTARLGEWVLQKACADAKTFLSRHLAIAVNISPGQWRGQADLARTVERAVRESGIDPRRLKLELTEDALLMAEEVRCLDALERLRRSGIQVSVDDFGTGHSSLARLRRFPIDEIKIDRSFVAGLGRDGDDEAIVRAIIGLGRALGRRVVAEGVETEEQLAFLRAEGCHCGQGFLFARAMTAEALVARFGAGAAPRRRRVDSAVAGA